MQNNYFTWKIQFKLLWRPEVLEIVVNCKVGFQKNILSCITMVSSVADEIWKEQLSDDIYQKMYQCVYVQIESRIFPCFEGFLSIGCSITMPYVARVSQGQAFLVQP